MSKITITDEQAIRAAIVAYIQTIPLAGNVFDRRRSVSSRNDFFEKLGKIGVDSNEIQFVEVELINVEDDQTEGPDDCPVATLTYNLHCFHEFADLRSDNSNSDKDFTDLLLRLRSAFLDKREFPVTNWIAETLPLVSAEFTAIGNDTFTGVLGHSKDLTLTINVYDD